MTDGSDRARSPEDPVPPQGEETEDDLDVLGDDELGEIDWDDLQGFFFDHLAGQLEAMEERMAEGDTATLSRVGHGLKGSGGGVRLPRFSELGRKLEEAGRAGNPEAILAACRAIRDEYLKHRPEARERLGGLFREGFRKAG